MARNDAHHRKATVFVRDWLSRDGVFLLSDVVFAETMTLLKMRLGASVAVTAGRELRHNPAYAWISLGAEGERDTWATFQRYDDKEWSYTDCALFVLARLERISQVFAFDRHFDQMPHLGRVP